MKRPVFFQAALAGAMFTLAACGGGSGGGSTTKVPEGTPGSVERLLFPVNSTSIPSQFDMYATDGSAEGTGLLKDFNEGQPAVQQYYDGRNPILFDDGKFYFGAQSPNEGRELRVSDGTEAGTSVLVDIEGSSGPLDLQWMDGKLAFSAGTTGFARELFVYDLDAETLTEIDVGGVASKNIGGMQTVGSSIFILGRGVTSDSRNVPALYVSDGSQEGTQLVFVEGEPVGGSVAVKQPTESLAVQRAEAPANAPHVLSNGDFYPTNIQWYNLTSFAGRLFFLASSDPNNQSSLVLYSVAEDGSDVRRELGEDVTFVQNLTVVGDTLYFYADRSINAANFTRHVYAYDGTTLYESGDFPEGLFASKFYATSLGLFVVTTNNVYRTAFEEEEFTFTPMHPGDTMTTYTGVKSRAQFGELFTEVEGTIYFVADTVIDGTAVGEELWKTDGSAEGTSLVLETNDLTTGDNLSSAPRPLLARYANAPLVSGDVAGKLFFSAYDNSATPTLHAYMTDGTAEGTVKLLELPNQSRRGL
jgi:ELWxxDGT repeat protein